MPAIDPTDIACALASRGIFERHRATLGARPVCDLDECWVRRQFPAGARTGAHGPHSWHQDGALRHDFAVQASRPAAPLSMLTCWLALTPCGIDAPGLELVRCARLPLLRPEELTPQRIDARFPAAARWRPSLAAGDALVFRGDVLHRTHVDAAMTFERSSLELRFFDADRVPLRLASDRFADVATSRSTPAATAIAPGTHTAARAAPRRPR